MVSRFISYIDYIIAKLAQKYNIMLHSIIKNTNSKINSKNCL